MADPCQDPPSGDACSGPLFVDHTATGANDGSSWGDAYVHLQDAIEHGRVCGQGQEIRVAEGTYYPDDGCAVQEDSRAETFELYDGITLLGGYPAGGGDTAYPQVYETTLSGDIVGDDGTPQWDFPFGPFIVPNNGNNSYHILSQSVDGYEATVTGFTITASSGASLGGGVVFTGTLDISNCTILLCFANLNGAAIRGGHLRAGDTAKLLMSNCTVKQNKCNIGALSFFNAHTELGSRITSCTFQDNIGESNEPCLIGAGDLLVDQSVFVHNYAVGNQGSGVMHWTGAESHIVCTNCYFLGNRGGTFQEGGVASNDKSTYVNCVFSGNLGADAGTFYQARGNTQAINCTFINNTLPTVSVSRLSNDSIDVTFASCAFWTDSAPIGDCGSAGGHIATDVGLPIVLLDYNLIQAWPRSVCGFTVEGSSAGNFAPTEPLAVPLFVYPLGPDQAAGTLDDDLRLWPTSFAIDAGKNGHVPGDVKEDILGVDRMRDISTIPDTGDGTPPIVDIGAYEFTCLWDVNGDGTVNLFDASAVSAMYGCPVGTGVGSCDRADLDGNATVNGFDYNAVLNHLGSCGGTGG